MTPELIIAVDTSSRQGSVALGRDDVLLSSRLVAGDRRHAAELMPAIREMLAEHECKFNEITLFAYSQGPGSFTGLRIAAAAASLAQSATGCRVVAVPTLEVIALNVVGQSDKFERVAALLDAKSGRIFAACYELAGATISNPVVEPGLYQPDEFLNLLEPPFVLLGEGVAACRELCEASGGVLLDESCWPPSAENVLRIGRRKAALGQVCQPREIVPLYLRPPACEEVYEQRRAAARERRGE